VSDFGEIEATGAGENPVPLSATDPPMLAGEPLAASVAESGPAAVGLKTTLIVQLVPGAIEAGQLFVWLKSGPLMAICERV